MQLRIHIVMSDDCNEEDCGCVLESIDSVFLDETKAHRRAKELFVGRVVSMTTEDEVTDSTGTVFQGFGFRENY
jgi:hypothetical protein